MAKRTDDRDGFGGVLASFWIGLAVIAVVFGVGAWLQADSTTNEVCSSPAAVRVDDTDCSAHHPGDLWVYYGTGQRAPAIDGSTAGASHTAPDGSARSGVPDDGGS
ncbi:hypothetical protein LQ327_24955 [Actinomycetospora endophytica]|uniref:Uncharacterized protein n=1 Tax=Actinomycetospora endophytica TaxID=2291215 RepID=A0ABS8PFA3_9PSEU|nr:hypothetical protein [Actinomycetospora endophytica]MCD2196627.1 hypothetical protein [Actinomycetospora endophytica]